MAVICTDAGHGGSDSGAVWEDVTEKSLNLHFTKAVNSELKKRGHRIFTTRLEDADAPPLGTRCKLINAHHQNKSPQFDAIVSIHCNVAASFDSETGKYIANESVKGFYAIYSAESEASHKLAKSIAESCRKKDITLNHNGKISTIDLGRTLAWIHKTLPPATLLELGFMTNPEELRLLQDENYTTKIVTAICDGIEEYV
jgi:N-acetylmuramoyl-L-alanine amidase